MKANETTKFATEERVNKIVQTLSEYKKKYDMDILPTSKIQGLSGMNYYICEQVLPEMEKMGKIELVEIKGKKKYWRLIE